jgi:hypothetical protein
MTGRFFISFIILIVAGWFIYFLQLPVDIPFVVLAFMSLKSESLSWAVAGFAYLIILDHLVFDFIPLYSIAGAIIFGSATWLKIHYPLLRKPLSLFVIPIYTQFLWFMLLLGRYFSEGISSPTARYTAPCMSGNILLAVALALIFYIALYPSRTRGFNRRLLA